VTFDIAVVTLLPDMFEALNHGITGRALKEKLVRLTCWNPRDWAEGTYRQVDDKPYGGGPGMVMKYQPLLGALTAAKQALKTPCRTIYLGPEGKKITQSDLNNRVRSQEPLIFIAGRYEGIDARFLEAHVQETWSIGDFVLSGGELPAMVYIDALVRLLPGAVGHPGSIVHDSFMTGLLDNPHYTRPETVDGLSVPPVLLSGHQKEIDRWRRKQALGRTWLNRPDLLEHIELTDLDEQLLVEFKQEE
jgi:tRNA (guanine37-N1)-methyltransferase